MRFRRDSLGRALSRVAAVLLLAGCGLGADESRPVEDATPLYPVTPEPAWRFTAEDARLPVDGPVLVDPRWIFPRSEWASSAAVIDLGDVWIGAVRTRPEFADGALVESAEHGIMGIAPETGEMTWQYSPATGDLQGCSDQLTDGLLLCGISVGASDPWTHTGIVLLDPRTGEVRGETPLPAGTRQWRVADRGIVAVVSSGGGADGGSRMDRLTLDGETRWSVELPGGAPDWVMDECGEWLQTGEATATYDFCGHLWSVRLSDGTILFDHSTGGVAAIRGDSALVYEMTETGPGTLRLVRGEEVLAEFQGHEQVRSLFFSDDSPVMLRASTGDVVALDVRTGLTTPTGIVAGSLDSFDRVGSGLIVGASGSLFLHDSARPGTVLWSQRCLRGGPSDPVIDDAAVYWLDDQPEPDLVALRLADGAMLWEVEAAHLAPPDAAAELPSVALLGERLVLSNGAGITVLARAGASAGASTSDSVSGSPQRDRPSAAGDGNSLVAWGSDQNGEGGLPGVEAEPAVRIAAGSYHSIAVRSDGTVAAWGWNGSGQRGVPRGLAGVVAVAGGGFHNVALRDDGTVTAWGNWAASQVPHGLEDATAVSAGEEHTLALRANGTVVAWGEDGYGQATVPEDLTDVVAISAGGYHNLAVKSDGTVVGWGFNGSGRATPPEGLTGVTAVSAGRYHNLALRSDGTVVAWGRERYGRTDVPEGLTGVVAVAAGDSHSLALRDDGTVVAWGYNGYGETDVPGGLRGVFAIAAGAYHSLALTEDGRVVAWGRDLEGQVTLPTPVAGVVGVDCAPDTCLALAEDGSVRQWGSSWAEQAGTAPELTDAVAVAAGSNHGLALRADGTVVGWGADYEGQATPPGSLPAVTAISAGDDYSLAVTAGGGVVFWGAAHQVVAAVPEDLDGVVSVSAGRDHALALRSDGTVVAWGRCSSRECDVPADLRDVVAVTAGTDHSVALRSDGTVVAWGANHAGAVAVPAGLTGVVAIAAGDDHTLALRSDGTVVAWGGDANGQATVPEGMDGVVAIAAGGQHSLAAIGDR